MLREAVASTRLLVLTAVLSLGWDQLTKASVYRTLAPGESWAPVPAAFHLFAVSHVPNSGAAFGLFPSQGNIFLLVALAVSAAILFYHRRIARGERRLQVALGLIVGGALGNGLDRLLYGYVVDFLDFHIWPIFNFADVAIVAGVLMLALNGDEEERRSEEQQPSARERSHPEQPSQREREPLPDA